jgi:hypothetical protein
MDILNFISWIRGRRQVTSVDPAKTLLPVGLKDPRRDDAYLAGAITVQDFIGQITPGATGPTGPQGPQGPQGIAGPQGNQGPSGPAGLQGPAGVQGIQGTPGPVGPAGLIWEGTWIPGTSYTINDSVGYAGASWYCISPTSGTTPPNLATANWALLASQGAQGPQGIQGLQGIQGAVGPQGVQGPIGLTGATGTQGPLGPVGPTGPQGIQGVPGPVGPAGLNWQGAWVSGNSYNVNDAVGYGGASYFCITATSGTTTPDTDPINWALLASQGAIGPAGAAGATGATGATGAAGPQGIPGPVGPAGLTWQGIWSNAAVYAENDAVSFGGASYFCYNPAGVGPSVTDPSVDTANWALLAAQGATGPQGPQGIQGIPGPAGPVPPDYVKTIFNHPDLGGQVIGVTTKEISIIKDLSGALATNSILEISWGCYRRTAFGNVQSQVYLSDQPDFSGTFTRIATGANQPAAANAYLRNIRDVKKMNDVFTVFDGNQQASSDLSNTGNTIQNSVVDVGQIYILFAIQLSNPLDEAYIDRVRITEHAEYL